MTNLVPTEQIEQIVGATRQPTVHLGRADSTSETFYILHSHECLASGLDLRLCQYSTSLDRHGIILSLWEGRLDQPVVLKIAEGVIWPSDYAEPVGGTVGTWSPS